MLVFRSEILQKQLAAQLKLFYKKCGEVFMNDDEFIVRLCKTTKNKLCILETPKFDPKVLLLSY